MVERISWFATIDYHIFEFFEDYDIQVPPKVLGENIGYNHAYVGRRLRTLRDVGLLDQNNNQYYELSDLGQEFLAGDFSREEVEALDPDG
jgi:DNA-binding IclR family transcriptional regulator